MTSRKVFHLPHSQFTGIDLSAVGGGLRVSLSLLPDLPGPAWGEPENDHSVL